MASGAGGLRRAGSGLWFPVAGPFPVAVVVVVAGVAAEIAHLRGDRAVLFPEGLALSFGVLTARRPEWITSRGRLLALPPTCAALGLVITRLAGPRWLLAIGALAAAVTVLVAARSRLGPALSAAALPVVFDVRSWSYLAAVLTVSALLAALVRADGGRQMGAGRWSAGVLAIALTTDVLWLATVGLAGWPSVAAAPPLLVAGLEYVVAGSGARMAVRNCLLLTLAAVVGAAAATWVPWAWVAAGAAVLPVLLVIQWVERPPLPAVALAMVPFVAGVHSVPGFAAAVGLGALAVHLPPLGWAAVRRRRSRGVSHLA